MDLDFNEMAEAMSKITNYIETMEEQGGKKKKRKETLYKEWAEDFLKQWEYVSSHGVMERKIIYHGGVFYLWINGVYQRWDKEQMESLICRFLTEKEAANINNVNHVLKLIISLVHKDSNRRFNTWITDKNDNFLNPTPGLVMKNGLLLLDECDGSVDFVKHTPEFFCLTKLLYNYEPEAKCKKWEEFVSSCVSGDEERIELLQEWAGYLLMPGNKFQRFMLLMGVAGGGKGTYSDLMSQMLGTCNCSATSLRAMSRQFSLYASLGKMLNIAGDAETSLTDSIEGIVKEWTGGDPLTYEQKYNKNVVEQPATAKLMVSANNEPQFADRSEGTWRRMLLVIFDRKNTDYMNVNLRRELAKELPGILNWAIAGLQSLLFKGEFTKPTCCETRKKQYKLEANPARVFLIENYSFVEGKLLGVKCQSIYNEYRTWCSEQGVDWLPATVFGREVATIFPRMTKRRIGKSADRHYIYSGIYKCP